MVTLLILDGFGISEKEIGNAIKLAGTPNLDKLNCFPKTQVLASEEAVGLCKGQIGNSEVGHLNIGAGRIIYPDFQKINNSILDGSFKNNPSINETINHVKKNNSSLHLIGLVSNGGVHSHINHLFELVNLAYEKGIKKIFIHAITDGRDVFYKSAEKFLDELSAKIQNKAQIVSLSGRIYAMDREQRWNRIKQYYDVLIYGESSHQFKNYHEAISENYKNNITDEYFEPCIINEKHTINNNDGVIFFNFRNDRAREITRAITDSTFNKFKTKQIQNLKFCCMTEYDKNLTNVILAFPPEKITDNLAAIISHNNLKQFHISETTKYAHVTFFFNGRIEQPYPGEDRLLIESENVQDFAKTPKMKAYEITQNVIDAINSKKYDFILVNLSNADMVGHTGNIEAGKIAVRTIDECAYKIAQACLNQNSECIITADHGNIECMLDENGNKVTKHTLNPVPLWLVSNTYKNVTLNKGKLCNIAPTILKILNIKIPNNMEPPLF